MNGRAGRRKYPRSEAGRRGAEGGDEEGRGEGAAAVERGGGGDCGGDGGGRAEGEAVPGEVGVGGRRWVNQLQPGIRREAAWTAAEAETVYALQGEVGNHWARIARALPGRSDNSIKNYFYSTLRKALRVVNNFVTSAKHQPEFKNVKPFQPATLSKVLAVAENKAGSRITVSKSDAHLLARGTPPATQTSAAPSSPSSTRTPPPTHPPPTRHPPSSSTSSPRYRSSTASANAKKPKGAPLLVVPNNFHPPPRPSPPLRPAPRAAPSTPPSPTLALRTPSPPSNSPISRIIKISYRTVRW